MTRDRFAGCILGLALGDALGAPHEGGTVERLLWRVIGRTRQGLMRWTDDTRMALDMAESLVKEGEVDPDDMARRFAASYRWSRGYGRGAAKLLKRIAAGEDWREANRAVFADGSYGNGGAMRAPMIGLFFGGRPTEEVLQAAHTSAGITHAHELGLEGAVVIALATALAVKSTPPAKIMDEAASSCRCDAFTSRLVLANTWLGTGSKPAAEEVARLLGNGISAAESCVTALYIGLRFLDVSFQEMMDFVVECGGDVDTIGAMSGAIWGAARGISELPEGALDSLEGREHLEKTAHRLFYKSIE